MTPDELTVLLSPSVEVVAAGADLIDPALNLVEDISDDVESWSVEWNLYDTIHRGCTVRLARELVWGVDRLRLWIVLRDTITGVSVRWNVGVFSLITPDRQVGEDPVTFEVQGYDGMYLLTRQAGVDYEAAVGITYRQALLDVFDAAEIPAGQVLIEGASADDVLPKDRPWPLVATSTDPDQTDTPVTWLRIINDLQEAWNGRGVYVDGEGRYRCEAYRPPESRAPLITLDVDDVLTNIVAEDRKVIADVWKAPNRWVVICSNPPEGVVPSEVNGYIQVRENLTDGPTSIAARQMTYPSVVSREAASVAKLAEIADRIVADDRRVVTRLEYSTGPFPAAGHADVLEVRDAAAGVSAKVQAVSWSFDSSGSDVEWAWEVIA